MKSLILALAVALVPTLANANDGSGTAYREIAPAEWVAEMASRQAQIDAAIAPIRSHEDLRQNLAVPTSPLNRLTPAQRDRFVASLIFHNGELASYSWLPLAGSLSVTDTYRILALFGAQSSISSVRGLRAATASERAMLETSNISTMAAVPPWAHGICVVGGGFGRGRCVREPGRNCSEACTR